MNKIPSFQIDHIQLLKGIYVSRYDKIGNAVVTTLDVRVRKPYVDAPMNPAAAHTIEHIIATLLRNDAYLKDEVIYWGPMGCMTGFYLIVSGQRKSIEWVGTIVRMFERVVAWNEPIPGSTPEECGNFSFQNLEDAKAIARDYLMTLHSISEVNLNYPEKLQD